MSELDGPVPDRLRRALDVASTGVAPSDGLAETTWMRGRRVRRRRATIGGLGGTVAAGSTALAWALLGPVGMLAAPSTGDDVVPAATSSAPAPAPAVDDGSGPALVETVPDASSDDDVPVAASAETQRVWAQLRSACLEARGYTVVVTGSTLSATQRGAQAGEYSRDTGTCDVELMMRLPPVEIAIVDGEVAPPAAEALRDVYDGYVATADCVRAQGLPVDEAPPAEEFVDRFAREWMPSWHPWTAAAAQGHYELVRAACPVGGR
ncbi:hypothetical protein GCM10009584_13070 [Ornithinimicrobium humiphilum]|uniref:Uncharacterized protein n=1 Tax=Ornithinimicrobium humiphilum TaxID=125288 RepID=A0A543KK14_9MICO|nr:hypothetical protein [Ornithinimicrobium humiphilum]TQM95407.1 hypothetical protein FB476_0248 [Ornithinimicrobium humiphilum]